MRGISGHNGQHSFGETSPIIPRWLILSPPPTEQHNATHGMAMWAQLCEFPCGRLRSFQVCSTTSSQNDTPILYLAFLALLRYPAEVAGTQKTWFRVRSRKSLPLPYLPVYSVPLFCICKWGAEFAGLLKRFKRVSNLMNNWPMWSAQKRR